MSASSHRRLKPFPNTCHKYIQKIPRILYFTLLHIITLAIAHEQTSNQKQLKYQRPFYSSRCFCFFSSSIFNVASALQLRDTLQSAHDFNDIAATATEASIGIILIGPVDISLPMSLQFSKESYEHHDGDDERSYPISRNGTTAEQAPAEEASEVAPVRSVRYYATWIDGQLCSFKSSSSFEKWEDSFSSLAECCEIAFAWYYDACFDSLEMGGCV